MKRNESAAPSRPKRSLVVITATSLAIIASMATGWAGTPAPSVAAAPSFHATFTHAAADSLGPDSQVTADGGKFWVNGDPIVLRGTSLFCSCLQESVFQQAASWGMNVVRIPVKWTQLEPDPPVLQKDGSWLHTYNQAYINQVKGQIAFANQHGMFSVAAVYNDLHTFWQYPDWLYRAQYNSLQVTYQQNNDGIVQAQGDFWSDTLRKQFMQSLFAYVAGQLADVPGVAGYELLNEPHWGTLPSNLATTTMVLDWQLRVAQAVRNKDPNRIIFLQTRADNDLGLADGDLTGFQALGNVAIDLHDYFGARYGNGTLVDRNNSNYGEAHQQLYQNVLSAPAPYAGTTFSQMRFIQFTMNAAAKYGFPVMIGEFGDSPDDPGIYLFLGTGTAAFKATGVSWTVNHADVVDPDTQQLTPWAPIILDALKG
jgi:aryl-phospho-beta-D-glucosidase BglC (GH1 family)